MGRITSFPLQVRHSRQIVRFAFLFATLNCTFPHPTYAVDNSIELSNCTEEDRVPGKYLVRLRSTRVSDSATTSSFGTTATFVAGSAKESADSIPVLSRAFAGNSASWIYKAPSLPNKNDPANSLSSVSRAKLDFLESEQGDPPPSLVVATLREGDLTELQNDPSVLSIEPDCRFRLSQLPADPLNSSLWAPNVINLPAAWDITTDASSVIVSVSDTGIDTGHPDLRSNLFNNLFEQNGKPGVDDDRNGCIDDFQGCDLADQDGDPRPTSNFEMAHGTHVAGIIGATGNNGLGLSGVAWRVQILPAKGFLNVDGTATISDLLKTIYYSINQGARIINCSWGAARKPTKAESDAFRYALSKGVLPIVAAGNDSIDAANATPAGIDGVLTVGSISSKRTVSSFSNFGAVVKIYAPGGDSLARGGWTDEFVYSTVSVAQGSYGSMRGTSMAAPFVTGVAALMLAVNPSLLPTELIELLSSSADKVVSKLPNGATSTISVLNAERAVASAKNFVSTDRGQKTCPSNACLTEPTPSPSTDWLSANESSSGGGCGTIKNHNDISSFKNARGTFPIDDLSLSALVFMILLMTPFAFAIRLRFSSIAPR